MARIEHYEFGRIVVDGGEERRDLIILPDRVVRNWWRQDGHALVLKDLDQVLYDLPEHLVIGTGAYGQLRPNQHTLRQLDPSSAVDGHVRARLSATWLVRGLPSA